MNDPPTMTRRWLARLSFSFIIIGFFLAWQGWKLAQAAGAETQWRVLLYLVAAALSFVLGFLGVRERHR
jgi:hypothetical protein